MPRSERATRSNRHDSGARTRAHAPGALGWVLAGLVLLAAVAVAVLLLAPTLADMPVAAPITVLFALTSILAFGFYARDKRAAVAGRRRTPESTLLTLGLIGGWPGALAAQHVFRHKNRKASFQASFWVTVLLNLAALVALLVLA